MKTKKLNRKTSSLFSVLFLKKSKKKSKKLKIFGKTLDKIIHMIYNIIIKQYRRLEMKKYYDYFHVVDGCHIELPEGFCVYGNEHQIVQFQFMMLEKMAKAWERRFNPLDLLKPRGWNNNSVYIGGEITYNAPVYFQKGLEWLNLDEFFTE